jgi:hypothetical protein
VRSDELVILVDPRCAFRHETPHVKLSILPDTMTLVAVKDRVPRHTAIVSKLVKLVALDQ